MGTVESIFQTEAAGDALILVPQSNLSELELLGFDDTARQVMELFHQRKAHHVILDFSKTTYYGSTALNFFVQLWKSVRDANGKMVFCHLSEHEMDVLKQTRLDTLWAICATREEALAALERGQ